MDKQKIMLREGFLFTDQYELPMPSSGDWRIAWARIWSPPPARPRWVVSTSSSD
jgi:hypothetical protein